MTRILILSALWLACSLSATLRAQTVGEPTAMSPEDYHARYGRAEMNISCPANTRMPFEKGLLQLHSFAFSEARQNFHDAARLDPDCAMAWWGVAMTYYDGLHEPPADEDVRAAREALARAERAKTATERERAWVAAAAEIYRGYPDVARVERDRHYNQALAGIVERWPEDDEARIFHALSQLYLARRGEDEALLMQAAEALEPIFDRLPDHPGIAHYLIHAYDDSGNRELGLEAAQRYAGIAPVLTHPQHMPSHIFAGLGMWEESNSSNAGALEDDPTYYHSLMYLVYGHLHMGQWQEARRLVSNLESYAHSPEGGKAERRGLHSVNTWLLLDTRDWEAAATAPAHSDAALDMAETFYVRGLGNARTGRLEEARAALGSIQNLLAKMDEINDSGIAVRLTLTRIQALEVEAMIALAEGRKEDAVQRMTEATELEDGPGLNRAPPDSGTGLPAHEVMGEILLEIGRPAEARTHFEAALLRTPNRIHSIIGLARAAKAMGDPDAARAHYEHVLHNLENADADMPLLAEARTAIGG